MNMQFQQDVCRSDNFAQLQQALGDNLAAEVEFKWLMASQGWWVDAARFESDADYAGELLLLATKSQSFALRECASNLRHQSDPKTASSRSRLGASPLTLRAV
jgi:hypothetical protein